MQSQIGRAPLAWGSGNTKHKNSKAKFTRFRGLVKLYLRRIIQQGDSTQKGDATVLFSQEISDPSGVKLRVILASKIVSITDETGNVVEFSAYLVPELRGSLLEVESKFGRAR